MQKQQRIAMRDGATVIEVETTIITNPAVVDYSDIIEACQIQPDPEYDPFDCDGLEHERRPASEFMNPESMHGYVDGLVVTIPRRAIARWGIYDHARAQGASRQVARELEALHVRRTIDHIVRIYNRGADGYGVSCEFLGEHASCFGFDDYDYVCHDAVHDVAAEIVAALEQRGYTVDARPNRKTRYAARWEARRKLLSQSLVVEAFDHRSNEREFWR